MAVLGLSARADCIETLEKRVKSRCQSRVHHLLPAEEVHTGLAMTAKQAMLLPSSLDLLMAEQDWNTSVEVRRHVRHPAQLTRRAGFLLRQERSDAAYLYGRAPGSRRRP